MNIIQKTEFTHLRDVRLNRQGKKIGEIVKFKGNIYYFTYRTSEHFFIKFRGFGLDRGILKHLLEEEETIRKLLQNPNFELKIIIFYDGKREKRYYLVDIWDFIMKGIEVEYTKDVKDGDIESYGVQKILPIKDMKLLGYDLHDEEVIKYRKRWGVFGDRENVK